MCFFLWSPWKHMLEGRTCWREAHVRGEDVPEGRTCWVKGHAVLKTMSAPIPALCFAAPPPSPYINRLQLSSSLPPRDLWESTAEQPHRPVRTQRPHHFDMGYILSDTYFKTSSNSPNSRWLSVSVEQILRNMVLLKCDLERWCAECWGRVF